MKQTFYLPVINNKLHRLLLMIIMPLLSITNGMAQTPCTLPAFPASSEIVANAPEAAGYNLVYKLTIPQADQNWQSQADVPYSVNNTAALASTGYNRVAYYMKLESSFFGSQWVWVSMDAFTNNINQIGIPTGATMFQQIVHHMNVINNSGVNKTGIDGNLEFWSNCYTSGNSAAVPNASDDNFDFGDTPGADINCYGSFQVHDFNASQTLFAYNGWAYSGSCDDLGIGSWQGTNTDWTLTANACYYSLSEVYVFVNAAAAASCKSVTVYLGTDGKATITPADISNSIAGSCGILSVSISKNTFTCADKGSNNVLVTVTDVNNNSTSCTATVIVKDTLAPVIAAIGTTLSLGYNPSSAAIQAALGTATVTDNCGSPTIASVDGSVIANGCAYTQTRTWNATDASGNAAIPVSRTVSWLVDATAPVVTATGTSLSVGYNPSSAAIQAALGTATATDNCGLASLTSSDNAVSVSGCTSSQTRSWVAKDAAGNSTTVSRTATWTVDVTAPVITATGSSAALSCNPTAAAIDAALGTATATDNCGLASLTFTNSAVTASGNSSSETRTWVAKDAAGNSSTTSRTATWVSNCNHFYASTVTCGQFGSGAAAITNICYSNLLNVVLSANPSSFYYYTTVTAPATLGSNNSFCVDVTQAKSVSSFRYYSINKITASNTSCAVVATGSEVSSGQGRVTITGATPGASYTVAVNYNTLPLTGSLFPLFTTAPTLQSNFASVVSNTGSAFASGIAVAGSQGTLPAIPNCGLNINLALGRPAAASEPLSVAAQPNPSATEFNVAIKSNNSAPVSVKIFDVYGKLVQSNSNVPANTILKAGSKWPSGTYFVEVLQGNERKTMKIVKSN